MKSLQESLFDDDLARRELKAGDKYELVTNSSILNEYHGSYINAMHPFDDKIVKKYPGDKYNVSNSRFIKQFESNRKVYNKLVAIINMLLDCPLEIFDQKMDDSVLKKIKNYISDYCNPYDVWIRWSRWHGAVGNQLVEFLIGRAEKPFSRNYFHLTFNEKK